MCAWSPVAPQISHTIVLTWHSTRGTVHVAQYTWHSTRGTLHVAHHTWQGSPEVWARDDASLLQPVPGEDGGWLPVLATEAAASAAGARGPPLPVPAANQRPVLAEHQPMRGQYSPGAGRLLPPRQLCLQLLEVEGAEERVVWQRRGLREREQ